MPDNAIRYFIEAEKIGDVTTRVFCDEAMGIIYVNVATTCGGLNISWGHTR